MDKKQLDYYDVTTPRKVDNIWHVDLIYNGVIRGYIFVESEQLAKKFSKKWLENKKN